MIRSVGEDVEKLKPISIVSWHVNWLKSSLTVLQNVKHTITIWPSNYNYTPRGIPKRREIMSTQKLHIQKIFNRNARNSIIYISPNGETAHMPIS